MQKEPYTSAASAPFPVCMASLRIKAANLSVNTCHLYCPLIHFYCTISPPDFRSAHMCYSFLLTFSALSNPGTAVISLQILFQKAFQLIAQRCSPIVENVELAVFDTQYFQLRFLDRESRVDEQHGILTGRALARDDERAERSRDRSGSRNTGFRRDVYVQEGLYEARGFAFELRNAFGGRVAAISATECNGGRCSAAG